jgi:hypothetical protein
MTGHARMTASARRTVATSVIHCAAPPSPTLEPKIVRPMGVRWRCRRSALGQAPLELCNFGGIAGPAALHHRQFPHSAARRRAPVTFQSHPFAAAARQLPAQSPSTAELHSGRRVFSNNRIHRASRRPRRRRRWLLFPTGHHQRVTTGCQRVSRAFGVSEASPSDGAPPRNSACMSPDSARPLERGVPASG